MLQCLGPALLTLVKCALVADLTLLAPFDTPHVHFPDGVLLLPVLGFELKFLLA